ncbi:MAG: LCP family protein [Clostridiales bacterium]|jgi:LCP family protein required for cell wall assembly|nr:LCP family protein [Clostridiales bacterium]
MRHIIQEDEPGRSIEEQRRINRMIERYQRRKRKRRIAAGVLFLLIITPIILYKSCVRPPRIDRDMPAGPYVPGDNGVAENTPPVPQTVARKDEFYTFAIVGKDNGNGNTDTMLIGAFDNSNKKLNIISIPRDTLVNVPWSTKKANTFMSGNDEIKGLKEGLRDLTGFTVDSYFVVDMEAFVAIVDALDGVDFEVPIDMNYEDPVQDLYIHIPAGYQHLDGEHALQVVRFRSGYPLQDIDRIKTQQSFIKAIIKKCLNTGNLFKLTEFVDIFTRYVKTDLDAGTIIWYIRQCMNLEEENISFLTLPTKYDEYINGTSYCVIKLEEWLDSINSYLNPYMEEITADNVNIITRDSDGNLYSTSGEILGDIA